MNRSLDYELPTHLSLGQTAEKAAYAVALACLLLVWPVLSVATAILVVALLLPGHLGLSDLLQALGNLLPGRSPILYDVNDDRSRRNRM
jgi:hypothetical protein